MPRLWRYHLHYFDDAASGRSSPALAEDWLRTQRPGQGTGWEPYPLSRRIPNWIIARVSSGAWSGEAPAIDRSLARQARTLARLVEYHLLANHLLANLRALVFAGCYFKGPEADSWRDRGVAEWNRELEIQISDDGGHYERSPMYHSLVLADQLDLLELARLYPGSIPDSALSKWRAAARRMLGWLRNMTHPDGGISFFQDAAFGMAPSPLALETAGRRFGVEAADLGLSDSGYARLEVGDAVLLTDLGVPGPDYQPGHAHAGALSFELSRGRQRMLVNTGTSTYQPGERRAYERSTPAHNTFCAGGRDQSEMWAEFRVGARAALLARQTAAGSASAVIRDCSGARLSRSFHGEPDAFVIRDEAAGGASTARLDWFFHAPPDVSLTRTASGFLFSGPGGEVVTLTLDPACTATIEDYRWSPEFGLTLPSRRVRASWRGALPASFVATVRLS